MQKKFRVLRVIGTVWKVLAWIELVLGILIAIGVLLAGIIGMGAMQRYGYEYPYQRMPWQLAGPIGGIVGFFVSLVLVLIYFLMLYGIGELTFLFIAIEENTRISAQWIGRMQQSASYSSPSASYSSPPTTPMQE
jgi:hypothetical protein